MIGAGLRGYYVRRVARVYPSHLVTWLIALGVLAATARVDLVPVPRSG